MGAVIAAIVAQQQRELVKQFTDLGATTPQTALAFSVLGVDPDARITQSFLRSNVIRDAGDGRYYFDVVALDALRRSRIRIVVLLAAAMVLVFLFIAFFAKPAK